MEQSEMKIKIQNQEIPNFRGFIVPIIDEFIEMLEKNFKKEVLEHFYQNISTLKLVKKKRMPSHIVGAFNFEKNEILYRKDAVDDLDYTLFHEFFHLASCHGRRVGFHDYTANCGWGINEGYTEFLTVKNFGLDEDSIGYLFEISVANILNSVIGEEKMIDLYTEANLFGLSLSLDHYLQKRETSDFIHKLDHFTSITTEFSLFQKIPLIKHYLSSITKDISNLLAKMYIQKNMDILQSIPYTDEKKILMFCSHYRDIIYQYIPMDFLPLEYVVDDYYLSSYLMKMGYSFENLKTHHNKV